jgi:ribonuclease HI
MESYMTDPASTASPEFDRPRLNELDVQRGDYRVYIAASDAPTSDGRAGPSACAFCLRKSDDMVELTQILPGRPVESSEQKAIVAGLLAALERIPTGSRVVVLSNVPFVVEAINERLIGWFEDGRLEGKIAYSTIWRRILSRVLVFRTCAAELATDESDQALIADLLRKARAARPVIN